MSRALAAALDRMISAAPAGVPVGSFTAAQSRALGTYAARTGAIRQARKGSGSVFELVLHEVALRHLKSIAPGRVNAPPDDAPERARNIAMTRSSKGGRHAHGVYHLMLKPVGAGGLWRRGEAPHFDILESSAATGATLLPITPDDRWATDGDLWLVENQAMFDRTDWLPAGATGTLTYFRGEVHGALLRWLARRPRAARVVVFPDYDGNGISNLARVAEASQTRVELHLFPGWQSTLETYGDPQLHKENLHSLQSAEAKLALTARDQAAPLIELMIQLGKALEQESVWLSLNTTRLEATDRT